MLTRIVAMSTKIGGRRRGRRWGRRRTSPSTSTFGVDVDVKVNVNHGLHPGSPRSRFTRQLSISGYDEAVNYFGHAAVASWSASAEAGAVLGAMLPDFCGMCGARIAAADEAAVAGGIALHHATDAAFHRLPVVTGLMRELDAELAGGGCARGPRRAVSHIGVELLLDGVLIDEPGYRAAYLAGLGHRPALRWRDPEGDARFTALLDRLRDRGVPDDLRRPEAVAARVHRVLAHRPLLAPSPGELGAIRDALAAFQPRIAVAAETIVRALRAALAAEPSGAGPPPGQV